MKQFSLAVQAAAIGLTLAAPAMAAETAYRVVSSIKTGAEGPAQSFLADSANRRLFAGTRTGVVVIDTESGQKAGQIDIGGSVGGIALAPALNLGFASNTTGNSITVFDLKTLKVVKTIPSTGTEPGSLEYEPKTKRLFVSNRSGTVTVIAAESGDVAGTVNLGGRLRGIAADSRGHVFVADEERDAVHVVDAGNLKSKGQMPTWPATKPTGVLLDNKERRVYVSTASGRLVVLDPDIGQMIGYVPIGTGDSALAAQFLPNRFVRIFVPSGDGKVTVVQNKKLTVSVESTLPSAGARSTAIAVDEKSGKAYFAGANEILVLDK